MYRAEQSEIELADDSGREKTLRKLSWAHKFPVLTPLSVKKLYLQTILIFPQETETRRLVQQLILHSKSSAARKDRILSHNKAAKWSRKETLEHLWSELSC